MRTAAWEHGLKKGVVETEDGKIKCLDCGEIANSVGELARIDCSRPVSATAEGIAQLVDVSV
jgi:hypothetical protein